MAKRIGRRCDAGKALSIYRAAVAVAGGSSSSMCIYELMKFAIPQTLNKTCNGIGSIVYAIAETELISMFL